MEALFEACGPLLLKRDYPLSRISFVGTRGRVAFLCMPRNVDAMVNLLAEIEKSGYPYVVFGLSSNILWGDGFFHGVAVSTRLMSEIEVSDGLVVCDAGVRLSRLVKFCAERGLAGAEQLWGIPGTVGAAAVMNAGAFGREFGEFVEAVECWVDGVRALLGRDELEFGYRDSNLRGKVVLKLWLRFAEGKIDLKKLSELSRIRKQKFPGGRTLGSVFKNPFPFYAGRLIEEAGLKGYSVGKVEVSSRHANFIVSSPGAGAAEYANLISLVKRRVFESRGILLREEIVYAGSFLEG